MASCSDRLDQAKGSAGRLVDWDKAKIKAANFNGRALNALFSIVTNKEFKKISSTKTAKEA